MALSRKILTIAGVSLASSSATALAEPAFSMHVEAAAAAPVGDEKSQQFGWGGTGAVVPEVALHAVVGIELALGAMVLSDAGHEELPPGVAQTEMGIAGFSTIGPRLRPLATLAGRQSVFDWDGLWLSGGVGAALTGESLRPAIRTSLGWDAMSELFSAGPFVGFVQVVEPDAASLRPEDARIAVVGLSGTFAPPSRRVTTPESAPPADEDGDGIPDKTDACVSEPEDKDRYSDLDGCPDPDNDRDGILDANDRCPNEAEDKDGVQDEDGCPDVDDDKDGILEGLDRCPNDPEDKDGFQDEDGCPDLDNDQDGVPDASDRCPDEPETKNEIRDDDGCPDTKDLHVTGDRIVLDEIVHFGVDSAVLTDQSMPLLTRVAEFLVAHPEYATVRVSGHADQSGTDDYNLKLSTARALSVRDALVRKGVPQDRFRVAAFGHTRPREVDPASAENRRVEFEILERARRIRP